MQQSNSVLSYWGKTDWKQIDRYHPAIYHLLDVAACARAILQHERRRIERLSQVLNIDAGTLEKAFVYLACMHDIGKFSRSFQSKRPDLAPSHKGPKPADHHHTLTGYAIMAWDRGLGSELLGSLFKGWMPSNAWLVVGASTGHHGTPVEPNTENLQFWNVQIGREAFEAARAAHHIAYDIAGQPVLPRLKQDKATILSWAVAGLVVMSDWLGSNQKWFPIESGLDPLVYWNFYASPRAEAAAREAGVHKSPLSDAQTTCALFPEIPEASPVQAMAETAVIPNGPCLFIIEDATGSGKTEASIVLAQRIAKAKGLSGFYIGLPTMATANGMFERVATSYRALYDQSHVPSLCLSHGRRQFNSIFRAAVTGNWDQKANGAEAHCADWIADDRRRAFLADVGVGTIDQALLGVLPSKHQCLRLWGLADKVLIIDEAHAYDSYMNAEIEALLAFQAALGGSAIILSATLPFSTRKRLSNAFLTGLGQKLEADKSIKKRAYPLVTSVSEDGTMEEAGRIRPGTERFTLIKRAASVEVGLQDALSVVEAGGASLVIRNTVDEAVETADRLRSATTKDVILFHARFTIGDRLAIETEVLRRFGKKASRQERNAILVATQVVEQSLNVDFDVVVTDLAPIDLLIQRAGREWRHLDERPAGTRVVPDPVLVVISPIPKPNDGEEWLNGVLPGTRWVYQDQGYLWRSAKVLFDAGRITTRTCGETGRETSDVRELVEAVYVSNAIPLPPVLQKTHDDAEGKRLADRWEANNSVLPLKSGYITGQAWQSEEKAKTRLSEDNLTVRLAFDDGTEIHPLNQQNVSSDENWMLSEVASVRARRAPAQRASDGPPEADPRISTLRNSWGKFEKDTPLIVLRRSKSRYQARVTGGDGKVRQVYYSSDRGLEFVDP
jgi:CRISPR-associated endonuclease/helicase Cas3